MIRRIDHISIAVRDLAKARAFFLGVLGGRELFSMAMPEQKYRWTTIELGASCLVELIDPPAGEGFVQAFLDKRGEGPHHITIQVDDLAALNRHLEGKGVPCFGYSEAIPGWKELFIHPRHAFGTLIQFAEFKPLDWIAPGYVPKAYWDFAAPETLAGRAGRVEIERVRAPGGYGLEIRQGGERIRLSREELPGLIAALTREAEALTGASAG